MICCNRIESTIVLSQKLMENLDLNNINKGSVSKEYKVKSLEQRCFSENEHSKKKSVIDENSDSDIYSERDSLIQMSYKHDIHESVEYYQVLSLFIKYYNKWYIDDEDKFNWINCIKQDKNSHISLYCFSF